jgi:GT2 family glycosyltransferase
MTPITVAITTRNRPDALRRCLASIADALGDRAEVLVFDDASEVPASSQNAAPGGQDVRFIRDERGVGYIAGRNDLVRSASHDLVLLLDDDAVLLSRSAIDRACGVMSGDPRVAAVAFAQAEQDGRPWPEPMQPGRGAAAACVPSFIGFAHLLRRSVFIELGGYRADFVFYGEEKDYCLRLLEAGYHVVYLPDARIAHVVDNGGRDQRRYVRYAIRNDCLASLYNEPWPLAAVSLPIRLLRYRRMASSIPGGDVGGVKWILGELRRALPDVRRGRRAVSWHTIREWRRLARTVVAYRPGGGG